MRALLSSVGTRGDVQPLVALGLKVRELGHEVRFCVPPNFVAWVGSFGFDAVPVGVEMRYPTARTGGSPAAPLTAEQFRRIRESMPDLITNQFEAVGECAKGCDMILGANAHQYAARSIAELRGIPYVNALFAPVAIPSTEHAPPPPPGELGLGYVNCGMTIPARPCASKLGGITNLRTPEGWLYLAAIIDVYSRFVVGWAVSPVIDRELALKGLR